MRRRVLFWVPVLLLAGLIVYLFCRVVFPAAASPPRDLLDALRGFRCRAEISCGGMTAEADVLRTADGSAQVTLRTPEALEGLRFTFSHEGASISFGGLSLDVEPSSFLASSAAAALVNAVDVLLESERISSSREGDLIEFTAKGDAGTFVLALDAETGAPVSLSVPSLDFTCSFSDYAKLGD